MNIAAKSHLWRKINIVLIGWSQLCFTRSISLCVTVQRAFSRCMRLAPFYKEAQLMASPVGPIEVCCVYVQHLLACFRGASACAHIWVRDRPQV